MAYLTSLLVVAGASVVLAAIVVRVVGPARRAARSAQDLRTAAREGIGGLRARTRALRRELRRRRSGIRAHSAV